MAGSVSTLERIKKSNELQSVNLLSSNKSPEGTESSVGDNESWDSVYKPTTVTLQYESQPGIGKYVQSLKHLLPVRVKTGCDTCMRKGKIEDCFNSDIIEETVPAEQVHYFWIGSKIRKVIESEELPVPNSWDNRPGSYMPVDMTGCCAFTFFSWLTPLVWRTFRKGLHESDLYHCSPFDSCQINGARFSTIWNKEIKKNGLPNVSLSWALFLFMRTRYIISCLAYIICLACGFVGPTIFMRFLLEYIQNPNSDEIGIITWMLGLLFSESVRIVFFSFMWAINIRTAIRASSAVNALLYKKITRLRSLSSTSSGELVNLFSNDCRKIFLMVYNVPLVIGGPLVIAGAVIYTWWLVGPFCFVGVAIFSTTYLIQFGISYLSTVYRKKIVRFTDERISLMSEFLSNMKLIKLYSWEKHLIENVQNIRLNEKSLLAKSNWLHSLSSSIASLTHVFASIFIILTFTIAGFDITPAEAFTLVMVNAVAGHGITTLPLCVRAIVNGLVAISRLEIILQLEEKENYTVVPNRLDIAVNVSKATLDWEQVVPNTLNIGLKPKCKVTKYTKDGKKSQDEITPSTALVTTLQAETGLPPALNDISFTLQRGQLIGVCGTFGSGKSSLLAALLGQMRLLKGQVAVRGSVGYVPQQPWILNGSFRENVLFGQLFSSKRYYEAVYCCGLADDIAVLPGGDQTEIGERGTNISGGQKQRISLARAQYADKDLYLLDDPFSSVDSQVGRHIMQHCIKGALKDRSIILVSHDVKYLQECDSILFMQDGAIVEQGPHKELYNKESQYASYIQMLSKDMEFIEDTFDENTISTSPTPHGTLQKKKSPSLSSASDEIDGNAQNLTSAEKISTGTVSWNTYVGYMQAAGGFIICCLLIIWFVFQAASTAFSKFWLGYWLSKGDGNKTFVSSSSVDPESKEYHLPFITDNPDLSFYQLIYGLSVVVMLAVSLILGYFFTQTTIRASNTLHNRLLYKVFYSPMHFFETTPDGRILNIFTHDIDEIDSNMPSVLIGFLQKIWSVIFALLLVVIVYHWFVIPLLVLGAIFLFLQKLFRVMTNDLKRYDTMTRSPIFSHVSATVQGLAVIRAFHKQDDFFERFTTLVDRHISPLYLYYCSLRWLGIRMEALGLVITCVACLFVIFFRDSVNPAFAAMVLALVLQLSGKYQYIVRQGCDVESRFTSVERIQSYTEELDSEAPSTNEKAKPSPDWPTRGKITFKDVKMRYRPGLPLALKGLTFEIEHQEKIGIVGRTGSGKSSLGAVLFRLVELSSGSIVIDGVNIGEIGLEDLRSRLSIIPQQPVLFSGSLRYNLDPQNEFTDEMLWDVLADVDMKPKVSSLEGGLNSTVIEDGNNFSVGEKQLLCMARALLHQSKIVVLDEATASVDSETDRLIQRAIQQIFANSTVLTIAHRLTTVAYCDRVMVLSEGKIVEFDQPTVLLANPNSHFSKIMTTSHTSE